MIIDIHAHTTNHRLWNLHTETATIDDLEKLAAKHDVQQVVLMSAYFPLKGSGLPNDELRERISGKKLFKMFGSLDAMNALEAGLAELETLARQKLLAGIKLYAGYQAFDFSSTRAFPIYELAAKYDLPVAFHTGATHYCCQREDMAGGENRCHGRCRLDEIEHLARPSALRGAIAAFPRVGFILAHMGCPHYDEARQLMDEFRNVATDISGQFRSGSSNANDESKAAVAAEIVKFFRVPQRRFRVMFATDFPIQSYEDTIEIVKMIGLKPEYERQIFSRNASWLFNPL